MKALPSIPLTHRDILKLIETDLGAVEAALKGGGKTALPQVEDINEYLHDSGGKRFRPALLLLSARLCGFEGEPAIRLGEVVELIHVATLVHDDIIDSATVRRGRPSVNAKWGNEVTVLMGDWLYMTSFQLALELRNFRVLDLLIEITRTMVEGELIQLRQRGRLDLSLDDYLDISWRKTGCLFSCCGQLGAVLGGVGEEQEKKLASYGASVGMAFQLVDDWLDFTSDEGTLGKPVMKDLEEGKVTLPIITLMQRAQEEERDLVRKALASGELSSGVKEEIMELIHRYKTLDELYNLAHRHVVKAKSSLSDFPDSIYRDAMIKFADLVIERRT